MKFIKMHGTGNDYIFVNCFEETVISPKELAVVMSNRHFGIGGDGVIFIKPSDKRVGEIKADAKMEIYNADGSRAEMCGNGIRCVALFIYNYIKLERDTVYIETDDGTIKTIKLNMRGKSVETMVVNMGVPKLNAAQIPARLSGNEQIINKCVNIAGYEYNITCVNMGNPHCVIFTDDIDGFPLESVGPNYEYAAEYFTERINVEVVKCITRKYCKMRVWERGSGITLSCGTGACAAVVAGVLNDYLDDEVTVELDGGILTIKWDRISGNVFMTGDAKKVFIGEI